MITFAPRPRQSSLHQKVLNSEGPYGLRNVNKKKAQAQPRRFPRRRGSNPGYRVESSLSISVLRTHSVHCTLPSVVCPGLRDGTMFDEIDLKILEAVERLSGAPKAEILKACRIDRERTSVSRRIDALDIQGAVLQDKTKEKGRVFVSITPYGLQILAAGRNRCPTKEAEQQ